MVITRCFRYLCRSASLIENATGVTIQSKPSLALPCFVVHFFADGESLLLKVKKSPLDPLGRQACNDVEEQTVKAVKYQQSEQG